MQSLGSCSTGQEQCTSEPFVKNKGRVSSRRWYPAFCAIWRILGQSLRTQEKGQALTYRGVLSLVGVIYSAQQIGIYEIGGIDIIMWNELGISGGTAIVILIALYFVIKWAVKNGIKEAYSAITGKKTDEDIKNEKELKELGLDSENQ